ncbi:MAG: YheT family hydrolase [Terriglobales bacterium]
MPRRFLRGGHLQTLAGHFLPRTSSLPAAERRLFQVDEGIQLGCLCHWQPERHSALTAVLVHGLEGSSSSQYIVGTAGKAFAAGMNVVRMNIRGCDAETPCESLYHSGLCSDLGAIVRELIDRDGLPRIALAGYSMGGNMVLKLVGEWGSDAPEQVKAAVAISPGMDLSASADALHRPENRIYEYRFLWSLWRSMRRKAKLYPHRHRTPPLASMRSMRDFDNLVTAPFFGFHDAADYYARAAASSFVGRIAIPTLVIHALDDPFVRLLPSTIAALEANPKITLRLTEHGGHCAFLAADDAYDGRWAELQIVRFFLDRA